MKDQESINGDVFRLGQGVCWPADFLRSIAHTRDFTCVAHENEMAPRTCMPGHALFLGLVLGGIGDDDKGSLQLPIRREDFLQLIDRGFLSQESSIAPLGGGHSTGGGPNNSPRRISFLMLLTFFFNPD